MLERFLPRQEFSSYEDFRQNYRVEIPEKFNFAYDVADAWAVSDPEKTALAWTDDHDERVREYSFAELKRLSDQGARLFARRGIGPGDCVLLVLMQRVEVWVAMLALHKLGAIVIPASFQLKCKDLAYRFQAAGVKLVVCVDTPEILAEVQAAAALSPSVHEVMTVGENPPAAAADFRRALRAEPAEWQRPAAAAGGGDPLLIYFSSGTTGMPKMVLHDHTYPLGHIVTARYWQQIDEGGRHLTAADSGWAKFGWGKMYGQWLCGAAVAAYDPGGHFSAEKMLRAMQRLRLTSFCAPPTVYRFLIREDLSAYDFSGIRHCSIAGEPLNPEVYHQWLAKTGLPLVEGFGQSESSVLIANFPWFPVKPGSTGKFSPLYDLAIVDERGQACEDGMVGKIVVRNAVRSRPAGLFREYCRAPEAMASSWRDGHYNTGDMAWRDGDGYIWFVGRDDDVIKSSGYRIGPFEVESALMEHPAVLECAVTAYPDAVRGEAVKATLVLNRNSGYAASPELAAELQEHVKRVTAPYKYPRIIEFVEALPKTTSGKIRRTEIREADLARLRAAATPN